MTLKEILAERVKKVATVKDLILTKQYTFALIIQTLEQKFSIAEIKDYFERFITKEFTNNRIKVTNNQFYKELFGKTAGYFKESPYFKQNYSNFITTIVDEQLGIQKEVFIKSNYQSMILAKDRWTLYFLKGPALNKREFDFSKINSPTLRKEVKMYFKHILQYGINFRNDKGFALVVTASNLLTYSFPEIRHFKDIKESHGRYLLTVLQNGDIKTEHGKNYAIESMRKMIQNCSLIIDYLIEQDNYPFKPYLNELENIVFHNTSKMNKNTEIIPEEVVMQLDKYFHELNDSQRLIYEILAVTGLRIKEVTFLTESCLKPSKTSTDFTLLSYTPHKTLNNRKQKGNDTKLEVAISLELANKINEQIQRTAPIRILTNMPYIFYGNITKKQSERFSMIQESGFVNAVNRLIEKHQICNAEGVLWRYTSRQSRKTLAVTLIEQGASSNEIAMQFGHSNIRTTEQYYAEVRKKRLAEMNSEFFKKRFEVFVGEDNLNAYSEEERRKLYVDFSLNSRDVEFGKCSKHISEGPCGVRTGSMSCATCPKLCTGMKYIDKWNELLTSQQNIINELLRIYDEEGIESTEYKGFIEYQREIHLMKTYENAVNAIKQIK